MTKSPAHTTKLVVIFGNRMRTARELCGLSQVEAAKQLGYSNSSKLNKVELASDTKSIPFWLIPRAADVYRVSTDFLLGLADSWQCNHTKALQSQIERAIHQTQSIQNNPIWQLYNLITSIDNAISINLVQTAEFRELVLLFRHRNPLFDYMPLGAKLLRVADEASREAIKINQQLIEHRNSIKTSLERG